MCRQRTKRRHDRDNAAGCLPGRRSRHLLGPRDEPLVFRGGRIAERTDRRDRPFLTTMQVSRWTFIRMAHLAEPLMRKGGSLFTMTYYGSQMVVKNYNIMGVAKAALESAVRYIAAEFGPKGIRVHAIRGSA
jgi:enoyl-[acyl-carrier protein] reductase I